MATPITKQIFAKQALTARGWEQDVLLTIDDKGMLLAVEPGSTRPGGVTARDALIPGMANVHSHAFQRAMAGLTEYRTEKEDNFWSWREVMYRFVQQLTPVQVGIIARQLYIDMLRAGYTAVGEFHYLHRPGQDSGEGDRMRETEISEQIIEAARNTGIAITHMPVLYMAGGFGGKAPTPGQQRFLHSTDSYLKLLETLRDAYKSEPQVSLGIAPHSLRAVPPDALKDLLAALPALGLRDAPIHIHAAEQEKEVQDCLEWSGKRPVEWLLANTSVDGRWCLIHATHMTDTEAANLALTGAVVGLCPTTEANLGDGIFPMLRYNGVKGRFSIGTDSHVTINPFEELRWLEYAQRLKSERRVLVTDDEGVSVGTYLWAQAAEGGAQALAREAGIISEGQWADLVVLDLSDPIFAGRKAHTLLDTAIFATSRPPVREVYIAGRRVVEEGRHPLQDESAAAYRKVMEELK